MLLSRVAGAGSFFDFRSGSMQISKSDPPPGSAPKNRTIYQKKKTYIFTNYNYSLHIFKNII